MTQAALQLREQLASLSEQDRAGLAHFLLGTLGLDPEEVVEEEWTEELLRREERMKSGASAGRPVYEALADIKARHS
jgi:hypothetical protein